MSVKLGQLHLRSMYVLGGSGSCGAMQACFKGFKAVKSFAVSCGYDEHSFMAC